MGAELRCNGVWGGRSRTGISGWPKQQGLMCLVATGTSTHEQWSSPTTMLSISPASGYIPRFCISGNYFKA